MKILLTGANGYIGKRLIPVLVEAGHQVVALVRNKNRLELPANCKKRVTVIEGDLLHPESLEHIPEDVEVAYYLVHSMSHSLTEFQKLESQAARNFVDAVKRTQVGQIIYLSGISREGSQSPHLESRRNVEKILEESGIPYTILRAGIVIGSGSASFEIVRDLVEKLPVMIAPKWVENKTEPIAIYDVIAYLTGVIGNAKCFNRTFEIGGPDVLTYKEMMLKLAEVRGLKRWIFTVPVLTPKLSSYWLYFVTSTNFFLAMSLVESLKSEVVRKDFSIDEIISRKNRHYEEAVRLAFSKIEENAVISSWKDAWVTGRFPKDLADYIQVPQHGCLVDERVVPIPKEKEKQVLEKIWSIGGESGWYAMNWAWKIRGFIDQVVGGIGLRRGRTHPHRLNAGDALDFWRVLLADKEGKRLLLYAEMKVPGDAWLQFSIENGKLHQVATFRPHGVLGRLYWYLLYPFHYFVFRRMSRAIASV